MNIREALISMGYREEKDGHWLKPIGYQIFSYNQENNKWCNWFLDNNSIISLYESKSFKNQYSYLDQIKSWECFTRTDFAIKQNSKFELGAIDV